jgi:hypothetical protein
MRFHPAGQDLKVWAEAVSDTSFQEYKTTVAGLTARGSTNGNTSTSLTGVTAVFDADMDMFLVTVPSSQIPTNGNNFYVRVDWTGIIDLKIEAYITNPLATSAEITALNDVSASDIVTAVTDGLTAYDSPTRANLDSIKGTGWTTASSLKAIKDALLTTAQVNTECDTAISDAALATATNLLTANNNISAIKAITDLLTLANINTQCDTALSDYDAPTKAELDSAVSPLATAANLATVDSVVDAIKAITDLLTLSAIASQVWGNSTRTLTSATGGGATAQEVWEYATRALSTAPATPSDVATALSTYDAPTKAELDSAIALLATAAALSTVSGKIDTVDGIVDAIKLKTDYIPSGAIPSKSELDSAFTEIKGAGFSNETLVSIKAALITAAQVWGYATRTLTSAGSGGATAQEVWEYATRTITAVPSGAALSSEISALNDVSTAEVLAQVASALSTYDAPTKAELDSALDAIPTAAENAAALLAATIRTGRSVAESLRILEIMLNGTVTGLSSGEGSPVTFTLGSSSVVFTVDDDGNRTLSSVTLV